MCITIDDLPTVNYGITDIDYQLEITQKILKACTRFEATAMGFVNEHKLYSDGVLDSNRVNLLSEWLQNGHQLGNHSYSHPNYHKTSFEDYTADILKGERVTRPLVEEYQGQLKYFRHPYLRLGLTRAQHDSLNYFLATHGYAEAPVTIDNDDYLFAKAYHNALVLNDHISAQRIGQDFLDYMQTKLKFFESSASELFGRNIKHILLLHANKLNADYLGDLLALYQQQGYHFIALDDALKDEAYSQEITRYGDWGISWVDRWALSNGKKGEFFSGDPPTPDYIKKLAAKQ